MADPSARLVVDPHILVGKPVIKGTRLAVELVLELMGNGWSKEQIVSEYPGVTPDDILACLTYASTSLKAERVYPVGIGA
jgi:uncharacterized protein (DUF433 family)